MAKRTRGYFLGSGTAGLSLLTGVAKAGRGAGGGFAAAGFGVGGFTSGLGAGMLKFPVMDFLVSSGVMVTVVLDVGVVNLFSYAIVLWCGA
ncbi:hypothetical protein F4861DRAFT_329952 [Xylaria intraflava]|nr:hypothetical protein F4861DRAFT_329952 [Xylaria intraflava]